MSESPRHYLRTGEQRRGEGSLVSFVPYEEDEFAQTAALDRRCFDQLAQALGLRAQGRDTYEQLLGDVALMSRALDDVARRVDLPIGDLQPPPATIDDRLVRSTLASLRQEPRDRCPSSAPDRSRRRRPGAPGANKARPPRGSQPPPHDNNTKNEEAVMTTSEMPMPKTSRFWTHPGANFTVNVDHVSYAWPENLDNQHFMTFVMSSGASIRTKYSDLNQRDAALRAFIEFVTAVGAP